MLATGRVSPPPEPTDDCWRSHRTARVYTYTYSTCTIYIYTCVQVSSVCALCTLYASLDRHAYAHTHTHTCCLLHPCSPVVREAYASVSKHAGSSTGLINCALYVVYMCVQCAPFRKRDKEAGKQEMIVYHALLLHFGWRVETNEIIYRKFNFNY